MGDCDCSYPFDGLESFIRCLRGGSDMVIGARLGHSMEKEAMSFSHRYIGGPALSFLGRRCFHTNVHDFHCGLRAVRRESFLQLSCHCRGMEFATEMIGRAAMGCFLGVLILCFAIVYMLRGRNYSGTMILLCILLGLVPYLRYTVLENHAYLHYFFTYRAQLVTITALLFITYEFGLKNLRKSPSKQK